MIRLDTQTNNLIKDIFDACDHNKSGSLTMEETVTLIQAIIEMGGEANTDAIYQLVQAMDKNNDNQISRAEFENLIIEYFI